MKLRYLLTLMASAFALNSFAQTIYPIDRATMMVDGKFDFKVEFDEIVKPEQVKITINDKDFTKVLGSNNIEFVEKEDGEPVSAIWLRNVSIQEPGKYQVTAQANGKSSKVN
ncbi:hypothetical protein [Gallibacterium anatis]|nr:hypothetical protein [Gallibacterium anatis]